jgi:hypothetical protein
MRSLNVMALFCEDIREEKKDIFTLIGIMPDTINIGDPVGAPAPPEATRILTRLCAYIRINFDPDFDLGNPDIKLVLPNDEIIPLGTIESDVVHKAQSEAKAKGNRLAGVISRVALSGFRPPTDGVVSIEVDVKGEIYVAAALTFRLAQ